MTPKARDDDGRNKLRDAAALANLSSVGIALVLSMIIGLLFGWFIDQKLHTGPWFLIIFLILGIVAGFLNVFRAIKRSSH